MRLPASATSARVQESVRSRRPRRRNGLEVPADERDGERRRTRLCRRPWHRSCRVDTAPLSPLQEEGEIAADLHRGAPRHCGTSTVTSTSRCASGRTYVSVAAEDDDAGTPAGSWARTVRSWRLFRSRPAVGPQRHAAAQPPILDAAVTGTSTRRPASSPGRRRRGQGPPGRRESVHLPPVPYQRKISRTTPRRRPAGLESRRRRWRDIVILGRAYERRGVTDGGGACRPEGQAVLAINRSLGRPEPQLAPTTRDLEPAARAIFGPGRTLRGATGAPGLTGSYAVIGLGSRAAEAARSTGAVVQEADPAYSRVVDVGSGGGVAGSAPGHRPPGDPARSPGGRRRRVVWLEEVVDLELDNVLGRRGPRGAGEQDVSALWTWSRRGAVSALVGLGDTTFCQGRPSLLALKGWSAGGRAHEGVQQVGRFGVRSRTLTRGQDLLAEPTTARWCSTCLWHQGAGRTRTSLRGGRTAAMKGTVDDYTRNNAPRRRKRGHDSGLPRSRRSVDKRLSGSWQACPHVEQMLTPHSAQDAVAETAWGGNCGREQKRSR
ncbi:hypothetical protein QJS66_14340 [Kocuria rhizophila]|nr:hypothetical protein QJS66_14340 [Kocuria rhizophila]